MMNFQNFLSDPQLMQTWLQLAMSQSSDSSNQDAQLMTENKENFFQFINSEVNAGNQQPRQNNDDQLAEEVQEKIDFNLFQKQLQQVINQQATPMSYQYQIEPSIQKLFSPSIQNLNDSEIDQNSSYKFHNAQEQFQINQNNQQEQFQQDQQEQVQDGQEYMQMFMQFYQFFNQLQQQYPNTDPTQVIMQVLMLTQQQQDEQSQNNNMFNQYQKTIRDYNNNLPLDSIPETKESILEDHSEWLNQKFCGISEVTTPIIQSAVKPQQQISQTQQRDHHQRNLSNFSNATLNVNNLDTFIQKSDISSQQSQIMFSNNVMVNLSSCPSPSPLPILNQQTLMCQVDQNEQQKLTQNLNNLFFSEIECQARKNEQKLNQNLLVNQNSNLQHFVPTSLNNNIELLSPRQEKQNQEIKILSPREQQQNKLIEYMIDNDDFSNYKQRRYAIQERVCKSLSRKNSKSIQGIISLPKYSIPNIQATNFDCNKLNDIDMNQQLYFQHQHRDSNDQLSQMKLQHQFFSPQPLAERPYFQRSFANEQFQENEQLFAPELCQQRGSLGILHQRKKTSDKIKQIRKLNQQQRGVKQANNNNKKKAAQNGKLSLQQQNTVFEIRDLKKAKSKKEIVVKKPALSHEKSQKFIQSQIQTQQKTDDNYSEYIIASQQYVIEEKMQENETPTNIFKSLQSVWRNGKLDNVQNDQQNENFSPSKFNEQILLKTEQLSLRPKKEGQEVHIFKKPAQTQELKKIQERLSKYYQDKKKDEENVKQLKQAAQTQRQKTSLHQALNNGIDDGISMTNTLSSFKSLMMRTMSQLSNQPEQKDNLYNEKLITKQASDSINCSSIENDISCADLSDNIGQMISNPPKVIYKEGRNMNQLQLQSAQIQSASKKKASFVENIVSPDRQTQIGTNSKSSCLPNAIFFRQEKGDKESQQLAEKDIIAAYPQFFSRRTSLCCCGQERCICGDQDSKKDLIDHFQHFLKEMDNQQTNQKQSQYLKQQQYPTSNNKLAPPSQCQFNHTQNYAIINGQLSPQNLKGDQNQILNRRLSTGSTLSVIPFTSNPPSHSQSTQQILRIPSEIIYANKDYRSISPTNFYSLPKQDTNQEEEMRILNQENDMMQKAFLEKSHKLNLEESQRKELLIRIQRHKQSQLSQAKTSQNNTHTNIHLMMTQGGEKRHSRIKSIKSEQCGSLEERRIIEKHRKNMEKIKFNQEQREEQIIYSHRN